jgi:hypothetical protein
VVVRAGAGTGPDRRAGGAGSIAPGGALAAAWREGMRGGGGTLGAFAGTLGGLTLFEGMAGPKVDRRGGGGGAGFPLGRGSVGPRLKRARSAAPGEWDARMICVGSSSSGTGSCPPFCSSSSLRRTV